MEIIQDTQNHQQRNHQQCWGNLIMVVKNKWEWVGFILRLVLEINNHSGPFYNDGAGGKEHLSVSVIACVGLTGQAVWEWISSVSSYATLGNSHPLGPSNLSGPFEQWHSSTNL